MLTVRWLADVTGLSRFNGVDVDVSEQSLALFSLITLLLMKSYRHRHRRLVSSAGVSIWTPPMTDSRPARWPRLIVTSSTEFDIFKGSSNRPTLHSMLLYGG